MATAMIHTKDLHSKTQHLHELAQIFIRKADYIIAHSLDDTWNTLCIRNTGQFFKYEYNSAAHKLKVTDTWLDFAIEISIADVLKKRSTSKNP